MPRSRSASFTGSALVHTGEISLTAISFTGFTAVKAYDGTDNSGQLIFTCVNAGSYAFNHELACVKGLYVECAGTGTVVVNTI